MALLQERGNHYLYKATKEMSADYEAAFHAGEQDAAGRIIDFWGGDNSFNAVQEYCRATIYANVLDWCTAFSFEAKMSDYSGLSMPVPLVRGAHANPQMIEINEVLETCLPNHRSAVVDGANHFLITSHAGDCAALLAEFLKEITK